MSFDQFQGSIHTHLLGIVLEVKSAGFLIIILTNVLVFSGCATKSKVTDVCDTDDRTMTSVMLDDVVMAEDYVENKIAKHLVGETMENSQSSNPLDMSTMSPIQLLVVASHFYDKRPAVMEGRFDDGTGKPVVLTVGDSLYHFFTAEFYRTNRQAMLAPPPYLKSKETASLWMRLHSYSLVSMKREFAEYSTEG